MTQQKRRVSYMIPPPDEAVPQLQLPPHGATRLGMVGPLIIPLANSIANPDSAKSESEKQPRHRLGISSLALDTSTQLAGRGSPEGILYSGGRDGLLMSWDLEIPMKKRKIQQREGEDQFIRRGGRWEIMTGWADDAMDEEGEDGGDKIQSDGDILGDVMPSSRRLRKINNKSVPYENQWETDLSAFKPGRPSQFRQCVQANTDWVNDILLCNHNQTIISASSDGTVKAWNPHLLSSPDPSTIGAHNDYVRCLTHSRWVPTCSREQNWVASGSFDRTIKLWDLTRSDRHDPLITLNPPDAGAPKSSIYALASDPLGHTIASGSPERVIRLWDPRTGKRTGKLVGHTDNIRAILISDDSKYLLTGSADASIKLWSLSSQRCLHTFTHHTDSVWSLHSSHPSLEIFYSGDRSGLVCKVDVEDCSDISEGECVLLCQDADYSTPLDGINKIIAMDDNLLWTASGHSNIKRWKVPQRRSVRASALSAHLDVVKHQRTDSPTSFRRKDSSEVPSEIGTRPSTGHSLHASIQSLSSGMLPIQRDSEAETMLYGIPFESLIRLVSPNEPFALYASTRARDPEVATLYSAASVVSVPRAAGLRSPALANFKHTQNSIHNDDSALHTNTSRIDYEERELAANAVPLYHEPDDIIVGDHGLVRSIILNDRIHSLTVDTSGEVAVWDIVRGVCIGKYLRSDVSAASNAGSVTSGSNGEKERSPREVLEIVRERIEGEAVVSPWATADTKAGVLMIHITERCFEAEVYADEVGFDYDRRFDDESKLNIGKWVLRNLFLGFIREEQRTRRGQDDSNSPDGLLTPSLGRFSASNQPDLRIDIPQISPEPPEHTRFTQKVISSNGVIFSPKMIPALPPTAAPSTRSSPLLAPMIPLHVKDPNLPLPPIPQSPFINSNDVTPMPQRLRSSTMDSSLTPVNPTNPSMTAKDGDYFLSRTRQPSLPGGVPPTPDDIPVWTGPGKVDPPTPSTPGGLMGRLKSFGKMSNKRPTSDTTGSPVIPNVVPTTEATPITEETTLTPEYDPPKTSRQILLSNPLSPPSSTEAPTYSLPQNTTIFISEEAPPSFTTVYCGTVANIKQDMQLLEETMPTWLIEYLLMNKIPAFPTPAKLGFVLLPWPTNDPDEQLPELLNTAQSKLTASRYLRVRKLVIHVQEKLDKVATNSDIRSYPKAEDLYEILCNDVLLPWNMSLAAVRQYVWKQPTELTMYYRRTRPLTKDPSEKIPVI